MQYIGRSLIKAYGFQIRGRFENEPAFEAITLESERIRLFKEYIIAIEETCMHHHMGKKKKTKKHKNRRSRSRSRTVSLSHTVSKTVDKI